MQLELFGKEYPHEKKPTAKELAIIVEVFGEEAIPGITCILNDVIDLYPYKHYSKPSAVYEYESFLTIGASKEHDGYFYHLSDDYCIFLFHNFSMFPDNKRMKQSVTYPEQVDNGV